MPRFNRFLMMASTALILGSFPERAVAAPTISGVSGTVGSGGTITISGAGFGAKPTANPVIWDNFENGTVGASVAGRTPVIGAQLSTYSSAGIPPRIVDNVNRPGSSRSVLHDFESAGQYNCSFNIQRSSWETIYFSVWWRPSRTSSVWSRNIKPFQMFGTGSTDLPIAQTGFGNPSVSDGAWRSAVMDNSPTFNHTIYSAPNLASLNDVWSRLECWMIQSSPGVANGHFECTYHVDGVYSPTTRILHQNITTRSGANVWDQILIGDYQARDSGYSGRAYTDDLYVDTTQARVELCSGETWAARGRCELQIATGWSQSSITATVASGALVASTNAYLFVVAADGTTNSNGYPVVISQGSTGQGQQQPQQPPPPPTGVERDDISTP